jgi:hypothetical protein
MSDGVVATDPAAAAALARDLQVAARRLDRTDVADPGGDAVFGAATGPLAAIPSASTRWRSASAEVLVALAAGTTMAAGQTSAADRW